MPPENPLNQGTPDSINQPVTGATPPQPPFVPPAASPAPPAPQVITPQPQPTAPAPTPMPTVFQPDTTPPAPMHQPASFMGGNVTPASTTPAGANAEPFEFSSNPFKAVSKGLGRALTYNPISSLTASLLAFVAIFVAGVVLAILAFVLPGATKALVILLAIIVIFLAVFRTLAACTQIHDKSMTKETITGREALGKASKKGFWRFVGACLLSGIFTVLASIVLLIPGIIVGARLSLVPFIVYTEELGAMAAIKRSWQLTKGHTWEMLGVIYASIFVIGTSGGLLTFIGAQAGLASRYYELKEAETTGASTGKRHWLNFFMPIITVLAFVGYFAFIGVLIHSDLHKTVTTNTTPYGFPTQQTSNSYCYYPATSNSDSPSCVTKAQCQQISDCSSLYGDSLTDTTGSNSLLQN